MVTASLLMLGCGGGDQPTEPAAPTPAAAADVAPATLQVTSPVNGALVEGAHAAKGARLEVEGTAPQGTTVTVRAGCGPAPCVARAPVTGPDERWSVTLRVRADRDQRSLAVVAQDRDPASTAPDSSIVLLVAAPRAQDRVREPAKPKRSRKRSGRRPSTSDDDAPPDLPSAPLPIPTPESAGAADEPQPSGAAPGTVQLIGDSLAVGIRDLLPAALGGTSVTTDAEIGRSMATGMEIVRRAPAGVPLAISLFTNDDPRQVEALERAVRESVRRAGPGSCAVWATIVRPPLNGVPYTAANARLRSLARRSDLGGRLRIVAWDTAIERNPSWLAKDQVHATPAGYRGRAQLYAQALAGC